MLKAERAAFHDALLSWFAVNGRVFPWRERRNAFEILLAEKLLQQTAARPAVVAVYGRLLECFPTPEKLAAADVQSLEALIKPLGFKYRARELPVMAQALVARYEGNVPDSLDQLIALPGVGDYAARAVLSFAYDQDVPVVDTNVARWLYRLDGVPGPLPSNPARKKSLIARAADLVPVGKSREWNYAVLDLCALVCKAGTPLCSICPLRPFCIYGSRAAKT
jgi:A/G-specific adenine glycosylase